MDRGLGCADEVREGLALAACRECRVEQRRGVGAAADVGVADGRRLPSGPVSAICPAPSDAIGARDLRLRLLAGEPAEVRAADADAGQDPAVVLLAPCVQDAGADADGEQDAQDERDAEAEGERPSAPRRVPGARRRSRRPRGAGPARHRRRARSQPPRSRALHRRRWARPRTPGLSRRRPARGRRHRRCGAPDERRELGVAGGRVAVGCGGVGSPVGCGVGQVGHQMLMRGRPVPGLVPGSRDILARAREFVMRRSARPARTGTRVAPQTLRGAARLRRSWRALVPTLPEPSRPRPWAAPIGALLEEPRIGDDVEVDPARPLVTQGRWHGPRHVAVRIPEERSAGVGPAVCVPLRLVRGR